MSCLLPLVSCASAPEQNVLIFTGNTVIAFNEHKGNRGQKAFAVGTLGDRQVFGISYEWKTERLAADMALQECRKMYETQIGGPDNCYIYALNDRLCEQQVTCLSLPEQEGAALGYEAQEAFKEYEGFQRHKAFVVGETDDYQVWGFSQGSATEHQAVDAAMNECRKSYKARIGGPDNCVLYALDSRLCDELCLY